ncbi:MAG TPA: DUF3592 domain-containing protein [Kofleriaceae bacterium]|nr:DUF3592 domain-containing protein [Kofleriaceae bacterium]
MGATWIALIAFYVVFASIVEEAPHTFRYRGTAELTKVEEITYDGKTRYIANYDYTGANGARHSNRSMSDERPPLGPHAYGYDEDGGSTELVGMRPAPDDPGLGTLLLTSLGFLLAAFELHSAIRMIRRLRRSHTVHADVKSATRTDSGHKRGHGVTKLVLEYEDRDGARHEVSLARDDSPVLEDAKSLHLLVEPDDPQRFLTRFDLPPNSMTGAGKLVGHWTAWFVVVLPAVAILLFAAAVYFVAAGPMPVFKI